MTLVYYIVIMNYNSHQTNIIFSLCWGIRSRAFRTQNREIISVNQVQFERLSCETPRALKSVFIFLIPSFDQDLSSIAE
jgi:hypothetical protein